MNKIITLACLLVSQTYAMTISKKDMFSNAATHLEKKGFKKKDDGQFGGIIDPKVEKLSLSTWKVGSGDLLIWYSPQSDEIQYMIYVIENNKAKSERFSVQMDVVSFDPDNNILATKITAVP